MAVFASQNPGSSLASLFPPITLTAGPHDQYQFGLFALLISFGFMLAFRAYRLGEHNRFEIIQALEELHAGGSGGVHRRSRADDQGSFRPSAADVSAVRRRDHASSAGDPGVIVSVVVDEAKGVEQITGSAEHVSGPKYKWYQSLKQVVRGLTLSTGLYLALTIGSSVFLSFATGSTFIFVLGIFIPVLSVTSGFLYILVSW